MVKKILVLLFLCRALAPQPLAAAERIRVAVADNLQQVTVRSTAGLMIDGAGKAGTRKTFTAARLGSHPVRVVPEGVFLEMNGKTYRGLIEIRKKRNNRLLVVNELDVEEYLKGVVASEVPHDWEFEALKAQAVASRTYALYQKANSAGRPYHIVATVDGQVYEGRSGEHPDADRAVRETDGEVLTYDGAIIPAFYHASCGGRTESAFELWGLDVPYLQGVDCECQTISRYGVWEKRFGKTLVSDSLNKAGYRIGRIEDMSIDGITAAGRVKQVVVRHSGGVSLVPAEKFRSVLGNTSVPSLFFDLELSGDEVVISGRGLGHGVGLCQWGAREMAQRGFRYQSILQHYYPGTVLEKRRTTIHEKAEKKAVR